MEAPAQVAATLRVHPAGQSVPGLSRPLQRLSLVN